MSTLPEPRVPNMISQLDKQKLSTHSFSDLEPITIISIEIDEYNVRSNDEIEIPLANVFSMTFSSWEWLIFLAVVIILF